MALQPKEVTYWSEAIGKNAEKVDIANMTDAQRREIAEFVVQMMNDLQKQYWSQREPNKKLTPIKLTDEAQALAKRLLMLTANVMLKMVVLQINSTSKRTGVTLRIFFVVIK